MAAQVEWSKWAPTLVAMLSVALGAGIVLARIDDLEARVAQIQAEVRAHAASEGHTASLRRIDLAESERSHVRELLEAQVTEMKELRRSLQRVDRRTEALCAESPRCRKERRR